MRWRLALAGLFSIAVALVVTASSAPPPQADLHESANLALFNPGNIVSDGVFYNANAMDVQQIQAFLVSKGGNCSGSNCLKNYRQTTGSRAADARCSGYAGAPDETAATIVYKVAQACGINPQALLVILQKEQGLITSTGPSDAKLRIAMGFGCPDTAACDTQYYGFANQLYSAARQFQNYRANPSKYGYRPGLTNTISYYPATSGGNNLNNWRCGTARVYILNQATAGLYNYTPYVPNQAALNAGYGTGDACSSYGNRNFYNYFTDWFGSTQSSGGAAVIDKYEMLKLAGIDLGPATSDVACNLPYGGCQRSYAAGIIYWSQGSGAHVVRGGILEKYLAYGGPATLGYPIGDDNAAPFGTGFYTDFQGGSIYWSAGTGARVVRGAILDKWRQYGGQAGVLGYPTGDDSATAGGYTTAFQGGAVYWSAGTGARVVRGAILEKYLTSGGPAGLGFPTGDDSPTVDGRGYLTTFQAGDIYWSASTGTQVVRGAILATWRASGGTAGYLGFPTSSDAAAPGGGYVTDFQHGTLYWGPQTGTKVVRGAILATYKAAGGPAVLGYPTGDDQATRDGTGYVTTFQGGEIYWSASTGAQIVRGGILAAWKAAGAQAGYLGYPTSSDAAAPGGGYVTDFQYGTIYWSPHTGTKVVRGAILATYKAAGGPAVLGYPTGNDQATPDGRGYLTTFQGGEIYWSASTGAQIVRGGILAAWKAAGAQAGYLGFPTSSDAAAPGGGYVTDFQYGTIYWGPHTGTKVVRGAILATYKAAGGPAVLGYPTGNDQATPDGRGYLTTFQGGEIYWSASTGAQIVRGAILAAWKNAGGQAGALGFPTTSDGPAPGGQGYVTDFQGGSVYWSAATGARVVAGSINQQYLAAGGPAGPLGYPVTDTYLSAGQPRVDFQGGSLPQ
ncbi:N-acetylmuramoyl-L-alanine amidase [Blastococcus sp. SYSU D00820]